MASPVRSDPFENFTFLVEVDGSPLTGVSKVSALRRTFEVLEHRGGSSKLTASQKMPGLAHFDAIRLERALTVDDAFDAWAKQVASGANFRKTVRLVIRDEAGHDLLAYTLSNCWVSEYQAFSELNSDVDAVVVEAITVETEGWERA